MSAAQAQFDFSGARPASSAGTNGTSGADKAHIVAKLRKLMNTNGRTDAERDSAEILAAALAAKHGIDLQQIELAAERPSMVITERTVGEWAAMPIEASLAAMVCVKHFEVSQITLKGWMEKEVFIGLDWHLDIAEHVFCFLIKEFRWHWNHRRGRCRNRKEFIHGAWLALMGKLAERFRARDGECGLEISWKAKRQQYLDEHYPDSTKKDIIKQSKEASAARHRGWLAGRDIEIRPAVKPGATVQRGELAAGSERKLLTAGA
jgi:hypothetical protein